MVRSSVGKVSRFAGGANKRSKELWHSSKSLTKAGKRNTLSVIATLDTFYPSFTKETYVLQNVYLGYAIYTKRKAKVALQNRRRCISIL